MTATPRTLSFEPDLPPRQAGLAAAPMAGLVLLVIGAFVLVDRMAEVRRDPAVELPAMAGPAVIREAPAEVTVNLRADGGLTVDGRPVAMADLAGVLGARVTGRPPAAPPPRVVLRADRRQRFGDLDEVLGACRQAGLAAVVLRARGED